jgi:transposase InsO family protein
MGWHERRVEEEKAQFILDWTSGRWTRTELCARYGVSREAGYELVRRYAVCGMSCVLKRSRARHTQERATADEVVAALVEERQKHPSWGPKKLVARLAEQHPEVGWPAASTAGDILHRMGLVRSRRRRGTPLEPQKPFAWATKPNALWCVDFKGWFQTRDKTRCDPLTVTDAVSRYLIECRIVPPTHDGVWPEMDRLFREHGLPELIRSDNGPPFGSRSAGGLTRLSAHWLKLGIGLERIEPGHPEQNGRHERMHGTLKAETLKPPAATPAEQQQRFDAFRRVFNEERPHEALGQTPPARHWEPSTRAFPSRIEDPVYDDDHTVRRVRSNGEIRWNAGLLFLSEVLVGEAVGIVETETGEHIVRFAGHDLGLINRAGDKLRRFTAPRPGRRKPAQQPTEHVSTLCPV